MSKIKTTSVIKLVCGGVVAALTIAMCATPLAPLAICIAVCGAIAFGSEVVELIESYFHHETAISSIDVNNSIANTNKASHIDSQGKGLSDHLDAVSISSIDRFYSATSNDCAFDEIDSPIDINRAEDHCIITITSYIGSNSNTYMETEV